MTTVTYQCLSVLVLLLITYRLFSLLDLLSIKSMHVHPFMCNMACMCSFSPTAQVFNHL